MKNIIFAAVLSLFAVTAIADEHARDGHKNQQHRAEHRLQKMTKKLDLTAQQQEAVSAILAEAKSKKQALNKQYNIEAYHKEKRAIGGESRQKIDALLTDQQKASFKKMKKKSKKKKCD